MTWRLDKGGAGETVWVGVDEIRDMWHYAAETRWAFGKIGLAALGFALSFGGLAALSPLGDVLTRPNWRPDYEQVALFTLLGLGCLAAGGGCALVFYLWKKPSGWITRRWSLAASTGGLFYDAGPFSPYREPWGEFARQFANCWSVSLDEVARVEARCTVEWDRVRYYEGKPFDSRDGVAKIPDNEYQTFLFMADGSRRVIYTGNADREGAGMLAQAIGAWIEARRECSMRVPRPAIQQASSNHVEGFDL